jgi:hypothetical protein
MLPEFRSSKLNVFVMAHFHPIESISWGKLPNLSTGFMLNLAGALVTYILIKRKDLSALGNGRASDVAGIA